MRAEIHGAADDGYSAVADAFAANFAQHDELGAAVVVYVDAFGHGGAGGQLAFADDQYKVGFGYINSRMGGIGDLRATLLTAAVRSYIRD